MLEMWNSTKPAMNRSHGASGGGGGGHDEHVDEWHHHAAQEGAPQEEHTGQVNTTIIMKWFVVIFVFVTASIAFIMVYFNHFNTNLRAESVETVMSSDYLSYKLQAHQKLSSHGEAPTYTGLAGGKVQGPVGDAMKKVVDQYKGGKVSLNAGLPAGHGK